MQEIENSYSYLGGKFVTPINDIKNKLSQIKAVWYRRESFNFDFTVSDNLKDVDSAVTKHFTICEQKDIETYIHYRLQQIPHLSSYLTASVNKLSVLPIYFIT